MSDPSTSNTSPSVISSLELGYGHMLYVLRDGRIIDQSGQPVARASLSPAQASSLGLMTSGTFGLPSITSSKNTESSSGFQSLLESRLQARLQTLGSTLYKLTWKPWVMPSGVCRVSVCERRCAAHQRPDVLGGLPPRRGTTRTHRAWSPSGTGRRDWTSCRGRRTWRGGRHRTRWTWWTESRSDRAK